jgi:autotransporter-associated beta strand protein
VTVHSVIADGDAAGTLFKRGGGLLILDGANTYSGNTVVYGGVLELADGAINESPLDIDNAALNLPAGTLGCPSNVLLNSSGGTNATVSISGTHVSDWLSANFYSGTATMNLNAGGTLFIDRLSRTNAYGILRFDGGILSVSARNPALAADNWIDPDIFAFVADGGAVIDTSNGDAVINCPLLQENSSTGGLAKAGNNVLTLTAPASIRARPKSKKAH